MTFVHVIPTRDKENTTTEIPCMHLREREREKKGICVCHCPNPNPKAEPIQEHAVGSRRYVWHRWERGRREEGTSMRLSPTMA